MAYFGVNTPVVSSVLAIFMMGLAAGSLWGGRIASRLQATAYFGKLRAYAVAEFMIAVGGIAVPLILSAGREALLTLSMSHSAGYFLASFTVIFLALIPFCAAMGVTFPFALAFLERRPRPGGQADFSRLYLINVAGSVMGTLLTAFALIEIFGFRGTLTVAVALNLAIAALAAGYSFFVHAPAVEETATASVESEQSSLDKKVLPILFLLGFASLGLEVVWSRLFVPYSGTEVYTFAGMLATYLAATALGTFTYRVIPAISGKRTMRYLWLVIGPAAASGLLASHVGFHLSALTRIILGVAPISFLTGILTPMLVDTSTNSRPSAVGTAYAANLLGCIMGPLVIGFVLVPNTGNHFSAFILAVLFGLLGFWGLEAGESAPRRWNMAGMTVLAAGFGCIVLFYLFSKTFELKYPPRHVLHDHTGTVIATGQGLNKQLLVNGKGMTNLTTVTKCMSHLPLAHLELPPKRGLVICFGMGTSFRSMVSWRVDTTAVELVPSVVKVYPYYFDDAAETLSTPGVKTEIVVDDGRRYLDRSTETFDVIVVDPPPPVTAAASGLLYSKEFYESVKRRLKKTGILQAWIPGGDLKTVAAVQAAVMESFPHVRQFLSVDGWGFHYLASESPIRRRTAGELAAMMSPRAQADLVEWSGGTAEALFEALLKKEMDPSQSLYQARLRHKDALTDDRPYNEYYFLRQMARQIESALW